MGDPHRELLLLVFGRQRAELSLLRCSALAAGVLLGACATLDYPDASNLAAYCTPQNAYRLGYQSRAYFGGCPKEAEAGFLASLERGRGYRANPSQVLPYYARMEELEKQLRTAANDAERARLTASLKETEYWALHIVTSSGTYAGK